MTETKAKEYTLQVIAIILEEVNGYNSDEIQDKKLDEDCIGSQLYERIFKIIKSIKTPKKMK